jgi:tRNA(Arg) A34 adenosine deaminase TadA
MALRTGNEARTQWTNLEPPWRAVLQLAWEAYRAGSEPVGAVVVRADGSVMGKGRDHVYEQSQGLGSVLGGPLAHAAVVALAALDPFSRHEDLTLVVSSEPCALCLGAAVAATVGTVRFAAADPYAGATGDMPANPDTDRLSLRIEGPLGGPFGALAGALRLEPFVRVNPEGHVVRWAAERDPQLLRLAQSWATKGVLQEAAQERMTLPELVPVLWKALVSAVAPSSAKAPQDR